jgi:hypothetical protein
VLDLPWCFPMAHGLIQPCVVWLLTLTANNGPRNRSCAIVSKPPPKIYFSVFASLHNGFVWPGDCSVVHSGDIHSQVDVALWFPLADSTDVIACCQLEKEQGPQSQTSRTSYELPNHAVQDTTQYTRYEHLSACLGQSKTSHLVVDVTARYVVACYC